MKVKLYESQLNRSVDTGARPMTGKINTSIFAQLGGAATDIGKAFVSMGVEKMKAENAAKKLDAENLSTATLLSFEDKVETFINSQENNDPTLSHTAVPDAINRIFQTELKSLDGNKQAQQLFGLAGLKYAIQRKHKFLDSNLQKKLELGKSNLNLRVNQDLKIAGDSGADINDRIQAGEDAQAEINNALSVQLIDQSTANSETQNLNFNITKNTIESYMNGVDDAYEIATNIEDGVFEDLMFSRYYNKLNPDQQQKIIKFAKEKATRVENLKKHQTDKILKEETKQIKDLKRKAYNTNDVEEKTRIYHLLIDMNAFDSEKEKDDFEKEINLSMTSTTGNMGFAEKDDPKFAKEFANTFDTTMSRSKLLENMNLVTEETYFKYQKLLNTNLTESTKRGLDNIKLTMKIYEGADKVFEPSVFDQLQTIAAPYLTEYIEFVETEPSKDELNKKVQTIKSQYILDKAETFDNVYEDTIASIKRRLSINKNVPEGFILDEDNIVQSLTKLLRDVEDQNNRTFNTRIKNRIEEIKSLNRVRSK